MWKTNMKAAASTKAKALIFCLLVILPCPPASARIVIDIIKSPRALPIAVQEFSGPYGLEVAEIIKNDLALTGLFLPLDNDAFIEHPGNAFKKINWTLIGAEAVVKGSIKVEENIKATIHLYDVFEGRAILRKKYEADEKLIRPIAHTIASDIYSMITNHKGIFRSKIAFIDDDGGKQRLNIMDWDGKRSRTLNVSAPIMLTPHWSRDSEKLLYSAQRKKRWDIHLLNLKNMKERTVFSSEGTNIAGDLFPGEEEFALSSSKLGTPDIYIYNMPKSKLKRLTRDIGIEVSPAVSPDGETIAYVSDRGGSAQIYTMNKIGYNRARITFDTKYNTTPVWSPRGDKLAFVGMYEGKHQIFTARPDGTDLQMLTNAGNNEEPSFSPDGRFIVFTSDRFGKRGIYVMRSNGEDQRRITPYGMRAHSPRWSPK
jgi:TolB protein